MEAVKNVLIAIFGILGVSFIISMPFLIYKYDEYQNSKYKYLIWIPKHGEFSTNSYVKSGGCIKFVDRKGREKEICSREIEITKIK